jgi:hypothetical protein
MTPKEKGAGITSSCALTCKRLAFFTGRAAREADRCKRDIAPVMPDFQGFSAKNGEPRNVGYKYNVP